MKLIKSTSRNIEARSKNLRTLSDEECGMVGGGALEYAKCNGALPFFGVTKKSRLAVDSTIRQA